MCGLFYAPRERGSTIITIITIIYLLIYKTLNSKYLHKSNNRSLSNFNREDLSPMRESVTIILPLPSRLLSPNRPVFTPGGRIAQAKAVKAYRQAARLACEAEGVESGPWQSATAQASFYWPAKRRRDTRNAEAMLKPAYDGLVDAGLLVDDEASMLAHDPTTFGIDRINPRVEIRITRND